MVMIQSLEKHIKILGNIPFIFSKLKEEGFLISLEQNINRIYQNELEFALEKLQTLGSDFSQSEIRFQISKNLEIFNENFKIICGCVGKLKSGSNIQ